LDFFSTYAIAGRVPEGVAEDCQVHDQGDPHKYLQILDCDARDDYLVVGGYEHKVGREVGACACYKKVEAQMKDRLMLVTSV
jgi:hypothetical protein